MTITSDSEELNFKQFCEKNMDDAFKVDCKEFLKVADTVEAYLKHMGMLCALIYVNMNSLNLKLSNGYMRNHTVIVVPKGHGKTTFLKEIVSKKFLSIMDEKMYESELVKLENSVFEKKVCVHDDLIQGFCGLKRTQREQLVGFWTSMMSAKRYSRQGGGRKEVKGDCCICFGMASNSWEKHYEEMFESTFLDRVIVLYYKLSDEQIMETLHHIDNLTEQDVPFPKIKFEIAKKPFVISLKNVYADDEFKKLRYDLAMEAHKQDVMSPMRALQRIDTIMMASAFTNGRKIVTKSDFIVAKMMFYMLLSSPKIIFSPMKMYYSCKKKYPFMKDAEIAEMMGISQNSLKCMKYRGK